MLKRALSNARNEELQQTFTEEASEKRQKEENKQNIRQSEDYFKCKSLIEKQVDENEEKQIPLLQFSYR